MENEFSVYWWDPDGRQIEEKRFVSAQEAIDAIKRLTLGPGSFIVQRAIITDAGDCTNFEWVQGKGVVFPP